MASGTELRNTVPHPNPKQKNAGLARAKTRRGMRPRAQEGKDLSSCVRLSLVSGSHHHFLAVNGLGLWLPAFPEKGPGLSGLYLEKSSFKEVIAK